MTTTARSPPPTTTISRHDMTGDQLARSDERVVAHTQHGAVTGGQVANGCQVFLNVPYGVDVARWEDPQPLPANYTYPANNTFIVDGKYCAQPSRAYTMQIPVRDRLGQGTPTENPFFADVYVPSTVDLASPARTPLRPVRVFIHGGFLNFGSTSGQNYNQQFFAAEHFGEVRVMLGHRVSVLGFLANDSPRVEGNYGFKDCWLGLEWVRDNIAAFGGDPARVHVSGLSGGAHIVHQLLFRAAHGARTRGERAPFFTAMLQSNAILTDPLTRAERAEQFEALCGQLGPGVNPADPHVLDLLRDTERFPTSALIAAVERMGVHGTFRGVAGTDVDGWVPAAQMAYQRTGGLGRDLAAAGVRCVVIGEVRDEDAFYSYVHDTPERAALLPNVARYYPLPLARALLKAYPPLPAAAPADMCQARLGRILADGQVHLPARLLAADLAGHVPVVRYAVETAPVAMGYEGKVPHGADLPLHHLRLSVLSGDEAARVLEFHATMEAAVGPALEGDGSAFVQHPQHEVLTLAADGVTDWREDWRWPLLRAAERAVRGGGAADVAYSGRVKKAESRLSCRL